jgi:HPt (histidine-containing phosphotransfer) domain-containing protein
MNTHVSKPFRQAVLLAAVEGVTRERRVDAPVQSAMDAGPDVAQAKFLIFDRAAFRDTTDCLSPEDVNDHLRTLIARGESLLSDLRASDIPAHASSLAEAAHKLAGGAAMLGFLELACVGRQFERCIDDGGKEAMPVADQLAGAIVAAVTAMREELTGTAATAGS